MNKKIFALLLAVVMVVSMFAGCGSQQTATTTAAPSTTAPVSGETTATPETTEAPQEPAVKMVDTLVIGTTMANNTFNITTEADAFGRMNYLGFTRGNWVYQDATCNNELKPYFMTSFDISEDGTVLDFTYPTDAVWSDGEPVTGEDIVFSFNFYKETAKSNYLLTMESVEIVEEGHARVTFSANSAYQYLINAAMNHGVLPEHIWKEYVGNDDYKTASGGAYAVGCGPFKLVSNDVDAQIATYECIPQNNYHGDVTINKVIVKTYADQTAILMALLQGEIDCYYSYSSPIDATLLGMIEGDANIDLGESYYAGQNQITFGMARNPGDDYNFRLAVTKAMDWDLLADVQGGEYAEVPNTGLIAPPNTGYKADLPKFQQNIEEAKKILDDAGYLDVNGDGYRELPDGSEMKVLVVPQYSKSMDLRNRIAEVLIDNMAAVGINAYVDQEIIASSEVWESNILEGNYDIAIGYTTAGIAKFRTAFRYYVAEPQPGTTRESAWLWGTYKDEKFNATVWQMIESTSEQEYIDCVQYLQQEANDTLFGAALAWTKSFYPFRTDKIAGWNNWPSWGVINNDTWHELTAK